MPPLAPQGTANPSYVPNATGAGSLDPTISSASLTPTTPITPIQPTPQPNVPGVDSSTYTTATTLGANEQSASDLTKQIEALNTSLTGKSAYQTSQNTAAGVDTIQTAINDNTTAIKQLQNEANIIPQQIQQDALGRGQTAAGVAPIQTGQLRENAIKALKLSSISDALSNNLVAAQTKANQAVAAMYGQQEADLAAKTANLELILKDPATTLEQSKRATAQLVIQNAKAADLAQQKSDSAAVLKTAQDAATNAANFKPIAVDGAYYPTLSSALNGIATAKTPAEATRIQTLTGLIKSENKSQIIGSADTGYTNVVTDAQGKVISSTPVLGGTGGTSTKPLTPAEITQWQTDFPTAGITAGDTFASANTKAHPVIDYSKSVINGLNVTLPNGSVWTAPNQQALDQFKADNKIGGTTAPATVTPPATVSPIEKIIAQYKSQGILNTGDIRDVLQRQGYTPAQINASSLGKTPADTVAGFLSPLTKLFGK